MEILKNILRTFQIDWEASTHCEKDLEGFFLPIANEVLCNGCFEYDDFVLEPNAIEFYFHEEVEDGIKDHIMYHTNEQVPQFMKNRGQESYPYFELGAFNLHPSGVDVTFENEKSNRPYRASFLIREYTYRKKGGYGKNDRCSTHIFDDLFPMGVTIETLMKIHWGKRENPRDSKKVKRDVRLNVAEYQLNDKGKYKKIPAEGRRTAQSVLTKNKKYVQCTREWQFRIDSDSDEI